MKKGQRVKCTKLFTNDFPKYIVGKKGTIIKCCRPEDGIPVFVVQLDCRKNPVHLWTDEIEKI